MILLTGHKGFVGGEIMRHLSKSGHPFKPIDRMETFYLWHEKIERLFKENRFDAVIAAGAISDNQYKNSDIYTWNTFAMEILASHCAQQSAHLIFFSSQTARTPKTLYGKSKQFAENAIKATHALDACILQPFNIWGAGENIKPPNCQSLPHRLASRNLEVFWETERDYVHVSDVVSAVRQAMDKRLTGTYHVGTGKATKSTDLAKLIEWTGYTRQPTPAHIEKYTCADPSRFLIGWKPKIAVLDEIQRLEKGD